MRNPPKEVYFVTTDDSEERKRFYAPSASRLYGGPGYVRQFLKSHPKRPKKVYKLVGIWEEVTEEF